MLLAILVALVEEDENAFRWTKCSKLRPHILQPFGMAHCQDARGIKTQCSIGVAALENLDAKATVLQRSYKLNVHFFHFVHDVHVAHFP